MNTLLFCCCCCCCCEREREREREREDVSHRESKKRDDTFSTERARTRKGVRGKEVLLRRRLPPLYLRKAHHHVFVFNPQQEEYPKKKGEEKSTKKTQTSSLSPTRAKHHHQLLLLVLFSFWWLLRFASQTPPTPLICTYRRRERVERPGIREKRVRRDSVGHFGASRASCAVRSTRARSRFRKGFPFFFFFSRPSPPKMTQTNGKNVVLFLIGGPS